LVLWRGLPKERPNKNWVPTAAEVIGENERRPVVRFNPPGRDGSSDIPAAFRQRLAQGAQLLVLLDPLNPVTPYQMDEWQHHKKIGRVMALAAGVIGLVGVVGCIVTLLR